MSWRAWLAHIVDRLPGGGHRHDDRELDEEIRSHIEEKIDALMASGMSRADATAIARREFGNVTLVAERSRDVWRWPVAEALKTDARYALRLVARYPAFSATVILIAAVGIAACATTFSVVSGVLLEPLPIANADEVYSYDLQGPGTERTAALPTSVYMRIEQGSPVIDAIAASEPRGVTARWNGEPHLIQSLRITPSFFRVFGVQPFAGRAFDKEEGERDAPVALLGHALWRARFHGDSAVVGTTIRLDSTMYTIIGVMPSRFRAYASREPDVWLPLSVRHASSARARDFVRAQLRVRHGVSQQQAEAWLSSTFAVRIESRTSRDSVPAVAALNPLATQVFGEVEEPLRILMASVVLVLILISANIATMFVARTASRDQELIIRRALGASATRQIAQLITESTILVGIGGLLGCIASWWFVSGLRSLGETILPRMDEVGVSGRVIVFALGATLAVGIAGGAFPALLARRKSRNPNGGARVTGQRTSSTLVVVQISLSVMLLVGAGLLVKGFMRVLPNNAGMTLDNRTILMVSRASKKGITNDSAMTSEQFYARVAERMRAVAGVQDVAAMSYAPYLGLVWSEDIEVPGYQVPVKPYRMYQNVVSPNLFSVLQIKIKSGRVFDERDQATSEPVGIVNDVAAERWWHGDNPIGRQVVVNRDGTRVAVTVVGVMAGARVLGSDSRIRPELYLPMAQLPDATVTFVVNSNGKPVSQTALERAVWSVAPEIPISYSGALADIAMDSVRRPRFFASAMGAFAVVAVLLSAIAIYGLLTLDVVQRRQEIGIRMALGATNRTVGALVLKRAALLGGVGVVIGIIVARMFSKFMESLLVEVSATDATVFAATAAATMIIASIAASAPAYRAASVDPATSLRRE